MILTYIYICIKLQITYESTPIGDNSCKIWFEFITNSASLFLINSLVPIDAFESIEPGVAIKILFNFEAYLAVDKAPEISPASITRVPWDRAATNRFLCKKLILLAFLSGGYSEINIPELIIFLKVDKIFHF